MESTEKIKLRQSKKVQGKTAQLVHSLHINCGECRDSFSFILDDFDLFKDSSGNCPVSASMSVMVLAPVILLFFFFQKHFIEGSNISGGIK
ncbi:hypothetical protein [Bacillus sp. AK031]